MAERLIETYLQQQTMSCRLCGEVVEIPRRVLRDPEAALNMAEDMKHDHRECAENPMNPKLAASCRGFRKRIEAELAKVATRASQSSKRCRG